MILPLEARESMKVDVRVGISAAALLLCACSASQSNINRTPPANGVELLTRMHDAYAGKWPSTVTFVQRTIVARPNGVVDTTTWYEALKSPDRLRIDFGDPSAGNGALYTADSLYVVRAGKVVRTRAEGNPFLPLIVGVYLQPLDTTIAQIAPYKVDLSRIHTQDFEGKPTYVVGSASPTDTTSPQFWVEKDRLIVTRFLFPLIPSPENRVQDVRLENNVPAGQGWLATRVRMLDQGKPMQTEEYSDVRVNVSLPATFFQAEHWSEGPHWRR